MSIFTPEFRAGAKSGLQRFREMVRENAPMIVGAATGSFVGSLASPREEPDRHRFTGAAIGAGLGFLGQRKWQSLP